MLTWLGVSKGDLDLLLRIQLTGISENKSTFLYNDCGLIFKTQQKTKESYLHFEHGPFEENLMKTFSYCKEN